MKRKSNKPKMILKVFLISSISIIILAIATFSSIYFSIKLDKNAVVTTKAQVQLYNAKNEIVENKNLYRYIPYEDISTNIISAFIALEDKRFLKHNGIDYYRTAGAFYNNIKNRYYKEGGSTITQQLAKNTQLTNEKTIKRKIKELKLARDIEKNYSKEEILEMYLNAIYFGYGIRGIDSACRNYFDKEPIDVSINEAAMLAGIVKNPTKYSPSNDQFKANSRKNLVLRLMHEQKYIDNVQYNSCIKQDYQYKSNTEVGINDPYYANAIMEASLLLNIKESQIIKGKYKIYTNLDADSQQTLYQAFKSKEFEDINDYNNVASYSALLCDNNTASIVAYFSNVNNNIFTHRRQPASTIKPILVYAPAIEKNYITTMTPYFDQKININGYSPRNYNNEFRGWTTIQDAIKYSINTVAVQVLHEIGLNNAKSIAEGMGIRFHESDKNIALALGGMTYGTTNIELANAYMTLANGGNYAENSFIREIHDENGNIVYKNTAVKSQVISQDTAYLLTDMLISTAKEGTAKKLRSLNFDIASKTGTVGFDDGGNTDSWNISYSTQNTLCVWYGAIENKQQYTITSSGGGLPTLLANYIYKNLSTPHERQFCAPDDIVALDIDTYVLNKEQKLALCNNYTPDKYKKTALFSAKNHPTEYSTYFNIENSPIAVQETESGYKISFAKQEELQYKLIRENVYTLEKQSFEISDNDNYLDISTQKNNVYLYYLEIYCENERLGYSNNAIIFT